MILLGFWISKSTKGSKLERFKALDQGRLLDYVCTLECYEVSVLLDSLCSTHLEMGLMHKTHPNDLRMVKLD